MDNVGLLVLGPRAGDRPRACILIKFVPFQPRYLVTALADADDPFAAFSEWSSEADEKAYGQL